ncbi:MAG: hypothetical protein HRT87_01145 [Legionellales bacterium]|nr:hypothetical protein [Legionellales bacterium]
MQDQSDKTLGELKEAIKIGKQTIKMKKQESPFIFGKRSALEDLLNSLEQEITPPQADDIQSLNMKY